METYQKKSVAFFQTIVFPSFKEENLEKKPKDSAV